MNNELNDLISLIKLFNFYIIKYYFFYFLINLKINVLYIIKIKKYYI